MNFEGDLTGGRELTVVWYVLLQEDRQFVLQFLSEPDDFAADAPIFYTVADTFHFA